MTIAIYSRALKKEHMSYLPNLVNQLLSLGYSVVVYEPYLKSLKNQSKSLSSKLGSFNRHDELAGKADMLISIGGDGTLLDTVRLVRDSGIPVAGINSGRLGFLADIPRDGIRDLIEAVETHRYTVEDRTLIHIDTSEDVFGEDIFGLNEFTLHKTDSSSMITVHTFLNGEFLNSFWADGLIVATPTGSTAYSLSCGGPIIFPTAGTFVLTPVAPHNLNARPIVIPDNTVLSFEVETRARNYLCSLDSKYKTVGRDFQVALRKEDFSFKLLRMPESSYLNTLRKKLMWGEDTRNE
jgi:NAD+ kinase